MEQLNLIATTTMGLEAVAARELEGLGANFTGQETSCGPAETGTADESIAPFGSGGGAARSGCAVGCGIVG